MGSSRLDCRGIIIVNVLVILVVITESKELIIHHTQGIKAERKLKEYKSSEHRNILDNSPERPDPLDKIRKYRGGFNITDEHYWSSLIFTGIYGYSVAVLWLLGGFVYAGFLAIVRARSTTDIKDSKSLPSTKRCWRSIILGISLAVLVIIASGVVLAGSTKFHSRADSVGSIITNTVEDASSTIYNVTVAVEVMQSASELYGDIGIPLHLNSTTQELRDEATEIQSKARKYYRIISKGLKILKETTIAIVLLNMVVLVALIISGLLMVRWPFHMLLTLSWLLTFFFWGYFGLYFFIDKFAGDTCMALDEYRHYPHNSSLSTILPCNDKSSANAVLQDTKVGIHDLIVQVNKNISTLKSSNTFPNLKLVCNPFSGLPDYHYQPNNCSKDTIRIDDIPQILKGYTSQDNSQEAGGEGKFIPSRMYNIVTDYVTSLQNLLNAFPAMERLVNCQTIKDAFSEILDEQCKPVQKYAHMTWASMVVLSVIMVLLVVTSIVPACQIDKYHKPDGSVKPETEMVEQGKESYAVVDKVIDQSTDGIIRK